MFVACTGVPRALFTFILFPIDIVTCLLFEIQNRNNAEILSLQRILQLNFDYIIVYVYGVYSIRFHYEKCESVNAKALTRQLFFPVISCKEQAGS